MVLAQFYTGRERARYGDFGGLAAEWRLDGGGPATGARG